MKPGYAWSTSGNACMIHFRGGPYDGQEGLFGHDRYDSIQVSCYSERKTYRYRKSASREYTLHDSYGWEGAQP